jgi:ketosteroid isomerase-like protein
MTVNRSAELTRAYIEAVGRHDLAAVAELIADDAVAKFAGDSLTKEAWLDALGRLFPALERNEIRHLSADGDTACVVYDFVTNTPAGAIACVEVIRTADDRISSIELILDRVAFGPVNEALRARVPAS